MNDTDTAILTSLVLRTRNRLWSRRLLRALWQGCCIGAVALLLLALVHILFAPVSVSLWLPCLVIPVVLAALQAVLWQRPSCADAAREMDRAGALDDLLVSAWEMLIIAPSERPAGAGPVLRQAGEVCARIDLPGVFTATSPWRGRYGSLPGIVVIVALFLLQLSTPPLGSRLADQVNAGYTDGDQRRAQLLSRDQLSAATSAGETAMFGEQQGGQAAVTPAAAANRAVRERVQSAANLTTDAIVAPDSARPGRAGAQDAAADSGDGNRASPGPTASAAADDMAAVQFEDVARTRAGDSSVAMSGSGVALFGEPLNAPGNASRTEPVTVTARAAGGAHNTLFSISQRLQIKAYFDSLEDTP